MGNEAFYDTCLLKHFLSFHVLKYFQPNKPPCSMNSTRKKINWKLQFIENINNVLVYLLLIYFSRELRNGINKRKLYLEHSLWRCISQFTLTISIHFYQKWWIPIRVYIQENLRTVAKIQTIFYLNVLSTHSYPDKKNNFSLLR